MHKRIVISCSALLAFFSGAYAVNAAADTQLQPGLWEYSISMVMQGSSMRSQPMKFTRCLTDEDVKNPGRAFEPSKSKNQCKQEDFKREGNKYSFKVRCTGERQSTGSAEYTVAKDQFKGTMKINTTDRKGGTREMTQTMNGKRLGACKS